MKKKLIVAAILLVSFIQCYSQQESQYTQYMYNTMSINPAYTGTRGIPSILGLYRTQWVGLEGAPQTGSFSLESPISTDGQGMGLSVINDKIGPSTTTNLTANYSYPIQLSSELKMNLGMSAGVNFMNVDFNKLTVTDPDDPYLSGVLSRTSPNIGAGVYFHTPKWYLGLSAPQILETKFYDDVQTSIVTQKMHFYLMGGYVFDINEDLKFKPAAMFKAVNGAPLAVDLSANFLINDKLTLGGAYRWDAAVSALAGFKVSEGMNIAYAYDYDTRRIGNDKSGSHEIFMRFDLFSTSKYRLVTPRFF